MIAGIDNSRGSAAPRPRVDKSVPLHYPCIVAHFVPSDAQSNIIHSELGSKIFLSGPAGTGKTTVGVERLGHLLRSGIPGGAILVLTPQRALQERFLEAVLAADRPAGGEVSMATIGGLARRTCALFWPWAVKSAGFGWPDRPPNFLTLETAQYHLATVARPLLDRGYFDSLTIDRNRLHSQLLDNLNKSALVGFPHTEIGMRLDQAYIGEPAGRRIFADAQAVAGRFREYCLAHNLLDFSLQVEVFFDHLWVLPQVRAYLAETHRHLIYDNPEEDAPRAHDLVREWLPGLESALVLFDASGGFRHFLGADPVGAQALAELCDTHATLERSFVMSPAILSLEKALLGRISSAGLGPPRPPESSEGGLVPDGALSVITARFYPELLDRITDEIHSLVAKARFGASQIVVLAPYLSDALRFSLSHRLGQRGVPWRSQRPSRALREEPACRALITLATLAHPQWNIQPPKADVAQALSASIEGLDFVRARLLAEVVYRVREFRLASFERINPEMQERITFLMGRRFTALRTWLTSYLEGPALPLEHFFRRLFGEVLSQDGFGFRTNLDSVRVASNLVESVRKFRAAMEPMDTHGERLNLDIGREYVTMLEDGVLSASYPSEWSEPEEEAVLLAPAYTFLMMNRPVSVQVLLDIGSSGWYERLAQPLTHPYVLSRRWESGRQWHDADEARANEESLRRLASGLLHRCRERVIIGIAEYGESGLEQRGGMLSAFQEVLAGS